VLFSPPLYKVVLKQSGKEALMMGHQASHGDIAESVQPSNNPDEVWSQIKASQPSRPIVVAEDTARQPDTIRFVAVSDTHGLHRKVTVPSGDVLLHTGDFTDVGQPEQVADFHKWLAEQPHAFKIVIAGNHDLTMDAQYYLEIGAKRFHRSLVEKGQQYDPHAVRDILVNSTEVIYLEDTMFEIPTATITGNTSFARHSIKVWGSPYQPEFGNWAFNLQRGKATQSKSQQIPTETDILMTHGPPLGRGDLCSHGGRAGCIDTLREVQNRVKPALHVFGHIHEGYGATYDGQTTYVNACSCNLAYHAVQPAIVFDVAILPEGGIGSPTFIGKVPTSPDSIRQQLWLDDQIAMTLPTAK
jgi:Icc-related predicted phosphoesterase